MNALRKILFPTLCGMAAIFLFISVFYLYLWVGHLLGEKFGFITQMLYYGSVFWIPISYLIGVLILTPSTDDSDTKPDSIQIIGPK